MCFTLSSLQPLQAVYNQMRWLVMSCLIRLYTVCHTILKLNDTSSATIDMPKVKYRIVYFENSGVNG